MVDYLLKPIKLERFIKAVNKVVETFEPVKNPELEAIKEIEQALFIKEDQVSYQVAFNDILYVEAYGNYLKIHTNKKVYVTRDTMHDMVNKLPEKQFLRVHKSFIISLIKIDSISGNRIFINDTEIPIGEMYKMLLKQKIEK